MPVTVPQRHPMVTGVRRTVAGVACPTPPAGEPAVPQGEWDNRPMPERLEVQRAVAASAGEIFAVLTDPRGHVVIDSSGMLMAASGAAVTKAGDTFVVHMDREALNDYPLGLYDVTVEIVTYEQHREVAWTIKGQLEPHIGHVYGYRLAPIDATTLVTQYYHSPTRTETSRQTPTT